MDILIIIPYVIVVIQDVKHAIIQPMNVHSVKMELLIRKLTVLVMMTPIYPMELTLLVLNVLLNILLVLDLQRELVKGQTETILVYVYQSITKTLYQMIVSLVHTLVMIVPQKQYVLVIKKI